MKTIYLDSDHCCHVSPASGLRAVETDLFDGSCQTMIEGSRYVPDGESWTGEDGRTYYGPFVNRTMDYSMLMVAQRQYERDMETAADMAQALEILGVAE